MKIELSVFRYWVYHVVIMIEVRVVRLWCPVIMKGSYPLFYLEIHKHTHTHMCTQTCAHAHSYTEAETERQRETERTRELLDV